MVKYIIILFILLITGCNSNISDSNNDYQINNFEKITSIGLKDIVAVGHCLKSMSDNHKTNNLDKINKVYNYLNRNYSLYDMEYEDIFEDESNCYIFSLYLVTNETFVLTEYNNYIYFENIKLDKKYYRAETSKEEFYDLMEVLLFDI